MLDTVESTSNNEIININVNVNKLTNIFNQHYIIKFPIRGSRDNPEALNLIIRLHQPFLYFIILFLKSNSE